MGSLLLDCAYALKRCSLSRFVCFARQYIVEQCRCLFVSRLYGVGVYLACGYRACVSEPFRNGCKRNSACNLQGSVCMAQTVQRYIGQIVPFKKAFEV